MATPAGAKGEAGAAPQQYTSNGHVLGFETGGYLVSNGTYALKVEFVGAASAVPVGEGGDHAARSGAAPLGRVRYGELWKGISVQYDAPKAGIVRSEWHLAAGAKPQAIRLRYNQPVRVNADGTLTVEVGKTGVLRESAPVAWQEVGGERRSVSVKFVAVSGGDLGFELGAYDPAQPLVIDPTLVWNTFLGGSGTDSALGIAVDGSGAVYVAGYSTAAWGSPVRAYTAGYDVFVARLDAASGALQWSTFLGGSGADIGAHLRVDGGGSVYLSGYSDATWGSPVQAYAAGYDVFVARLDATSGTLQWNTFVGGSGDDFVFDIALDGSGKVYVAGQSDAPWGSPVRAFTSGIGDEAFAARLDATSGSLQWNTFLGGMADDGAYGIAADGGGKVYVTGYSFWTWGAPVRPYEDHWDVFVVQLDGASGVLQWNTFLGGNAGNDVGYALALDGSGHVYVAGFSDAAWGTPVRAYTANNDVLVARLDAASGTLQWNTFLGSSGNDSSFGIVADGSGHIYIAGSSVAAWGSPDRAFTAGVDAFAARLDATGGALQWNTFLGSTGNEFGTAIALDSGGSRYVAGYGDATWGSPVRPYTAGVRDAFVARIGLDAEKDFYVRDWTDNPGSHDLGEEPSTNFATNWAWSSDVWNRGANNPGSLTNGWYPTDNMFAGAGALGNNWGFVRVHRNASGSPATVTAELLVSEFGAGSNFLPITTTTLNFAASDQVLTQGSFWQRGPTLSTHACIAVQVSTSEDPYQSPGLAGHSPGDPNGQFLILADNNKAQRNLNVSHNVLHLAAIQFALIHNPALIRRKTVLRYESPMADRLKGAQIEVVGGETVDFRPGGSITLEGMQPGENRWVALKLRVPDGDPVPVHFYEMDKDRVVNAFTMQAQPVSLAEAIRDNLRNHVQVFNRLAAAFAIEKGRGEAQAAESLLRQREIMPSQYLSFLKGRARSMAAVLTPLVEQAQPGFSFGILQTLKDLGDGADTAKAEEAAADHSVLLHRLDAFATMLQKSNGDPADILQMVRWQEELYRTDPVLGKQRCSRGLLKQSQELIKTYDPRKAEFYPALLRGLNACFHQTAQALEKDRQKLERAVAAMERRRLSLATLEKAHREFLLALQDAEGRVAPPE